MPTRSLLPWGEGFLRFKTCHLKFVFVAWSLDYHGLGWSLNAFVRKAKLRVSHGQAPSPWTCVGPIQASFRLLEVSKEQLGPTGDSHRPQHMDVQGHHSPECPRAEAFPTAWSPFNEGQPDTCVCVLFILRDSQCRKQLRAASRNRVWPAGGPK